MADGPAGVVLLYLGNVEDSGGVVTFGAVVQVRAPIGSLPLPTGPGQSFGQVRAQVGLRITRQQWEAIGAPLTLPVRIVGPADE